MPDIGELGPIVALGSLEQTIRTLLRTPQVLGVYIDEAFRQNYASEARVDRPRDIVTATETRGKLNMPAIVVQAEGNGDPRRMGADRTYAASYVVGLHCITTGGNESTCRRTSDILAAAATAMCLQRLQGKTVGTGVVSNVTWDGSALEANPTSRSSAYAEVVSQLTVTVSGVYTDVRGRIPTLPPNDPDTTGPAPAPDNLTTIVDLPVEVEDEDPA
jgi:hypothetical protein